MMPPDDRFTPLTYLVTRVTYKPVSRMMMFTTDTGKDFTFTRIAAIAARMPDVSGITEEGKEFDPPLLMTVGKSGYLLGIEETRPA